MILAIDSGNIQSGWAVLDDDLRPVAFGKVENKHLLNDLIPLLLEKYRIKICALELIQCFGMSVGASVFDTCIWIGRFWQLLEGRGIRIHGIYRRDEKMNLCNSVKAKDTNIRQALIDRFAQHDFKNGKGTKKDPDWFYGVSKDVWSAIAVGVTCWDMHMKNQSVERCE